MCVGAHKSALTQIKRLLGQRNTFDGASVPLPEEREEENFTTGLYYGKMHLSDVLGSQGC